MRREYIDSMPDLHATWLSHLRRQQQRWLDALPSLCAVCGRWPGPRICHDCHARWAGQKHRCHGCALPLPSLVSLCGSCLLQPPRLQRCISVLDYAYPWQDLITRYKFQADLGLARSLGRLMAGHPEVRELLRTCGPLLPMPTSSERVRERGFDHCLLLAHALSEQYDRPLPLLNGAVQRKHLERPQHASSREQRLRRLRDVFSLVPARRPLIEGQDIVLLDDVMTTGATLDALARCLLSAGAASVSAVVLARTP
jgi:ComF family protein